MYKFKCLHVKLLSIGILLHIGDVEKTPLLEKEVADNMCIVV